MREFQEYYEKCYEYTVQRTADVENRLKTLHEVIEETTSPIQPAMTCMEDQKAHEILARMSETWIAKTCQMKRDIEQELFDLEVMIGECKLKVE